MAEGAGLENRYTGNGIEGSNPSLSVVRSGLNKSCRNENGGWLFTIPRVVALSVAQCFTIAKPLTVNSRLWLTRMP